MTKERLLKFAAHVTECAKEAAAYGKCVSQQAEQIKKDACAKEFQAFQACIKKLKSKAK